MLKRIPHNILQEFYPRDGGKHLQQAAAAGATTLDGLGMLVYQGAIAFKMWTGHEAPVAVMRAALEEVFSIEA